MSLVHHSAICTRDVAASLRFWRDGLGFVELFDIPFRGDWPTLFNAPTDELRAIFLGDPDTPDVGIVELVVFDGPDDADEPHAAAGPAEAPRPGFFLLSLHCDVDAALDRLAELGVGGTPRIADVSGIRLAVVIDPNGVVVELMDLAARANLETMTDRS